MECLGGMRLQIFLTLLICATPVTPASVNINQECRQLKEELGELYRRKARGFQIRSRARWIEFGERRTKYLLGLEKQRQYANCIDSLKNKDGTHVIQTKKYWKQQMNITLTCTKIGPQTYMALIFFFF